MNFTSFKNALGKAYETAASTAATAAKDLQTQVVGARCLRDYNVQSQVATGGLHGVWKIFAARSKKEGSQNKVVSIWMLDKRGPSSLGGSSRWDTVVELCKKDAAALTRLKHPAFVKILEPMEETRTQLVMVTEAIFASTLDLLNRFENVPSQRQAVRLSELDVKAGLLQVSDGLQFLHHEANLVHRGLSPGAILLTGSGAWKLAGLGLTARAQFGTTEEGAVKPFDYNNSSPPLWLQLTQAPLGYVAPELTGYSSAAQGASVVTPAADIFSLGALVYELVSGKQLFQVGNSLAEYQAKLASIHVMDFAGCPPQLLNVLRSMLSTQPASRPNANVFAGSPYFQEDVEVRALRFLEGFLQRDAMQKAAFLKDLEGLWPRFDARVLRYRVLPPLLAESRNEALQPILLPLIMRIVKQQDPQDFADATLPALAPLFASAAGQALFQLTRFADILYAAMLPQNVEEVLIPLLARAADLGDIRTQEEMLKKTQGLAEKADYSALKTQILPRVQRLALATTSAAVRQAAFAALTALAPRFDKEVAAGLVGTLQQILKVDRSNGTVSAALLLGRALVESWGPIFGAEYVLPVLSPCLAAPGLSRDQFREVYRAIEEMLHSIASSRVSNLDEDKPSVGVSASGEPQISSRHELPSWDVTKPASANLEIPAPPLSAASMHIPVPTRSGTGGARPQGMVQASKAASDRLNGANEGVKSQPMMSNGSLSSVAGDPFAMSGGLSPAESATQRGGGGSNLMTDPFRSVSAAPIGQASTGADLFSGMALTSASVPQAAPQEPDPFADWPPASSTAASVSQSFAQQPSAGGSSNRAQSGGTTTMQKSGSPSNLAPKPAPMRPPKLAPPPSAVPKIAPPGKQASGNFGDSLI